MNRKEIYKMDGNVKRKAGILIVLAALLCAALAGCSPKGTKTQATVPSDTSAQADGMETVSEPSNAANGQETTDAAGGGEYTFTDSLGQTVTVNNPKRVVALMGSMAETWLLAGGELVGVTDDAMTERGLTFSEDVQIVGKFNEPNVESILALSPDLVILSSSSQSPTHLALKDTLNNAGITTAYFNVTYFNEYLDMLKVCTDITGHPEYYQQYGLDVQKKIEDAKARIVEEEAPSVLFLITYSGGALARGSDTLAGRMIQEMGGKNIVDEDKSLLKDFSVEKIISKDPEYIFVVPMGNDDEAAVRALKESVESNPAWSSLSAVKNGRYILLDKNLFLYKPNARWNEAYEFLADTIYGER